jgi:hypothetical protein
MAPRRELSAPHLAPGAVVAEDLRHIKVLHDVIGTLDDTRAGAAEMAKQIKRFPALAQRITLRFTQRFPTREPPRLVEQIVTLGQREIERILFGLLEDLTILRGSL